MTPSDIASENVIIVLTKFNENVSKYGRSWALWYKYKYPKCFVCLVHICGDRKFAAEVDIKNTIHAPPYPDAYGSTMTCWYTITSPEDTRIRFWVEDFGTEQFNSRYFYMNVSNFP